jgi:hypothetical protein
MFIDAGPCLVSGVYWLGGPCGSEHEGTPMVDLVPFVHVFMFVSEYGLRGGITLCVDALLLCRGV